MISFNNSSFVQSATRTASSHASKATSSMERLSTGQRIQRASDDAAGLAQSIKLENQVRGDQVAMKNLMHAREKLNLAASYIDGMVEYAQDIRELGIRNGSRTDVKTTGPSTQRRINAVEGRELIRAMFYTDAGLRDEQGERVSMMLNGLTIQSGSGGSDTYALNIGDLRVSHPDGIGGSYGSDNPFGVWGHSAWDSSDTYSTLARNMPEFMERVSERRAQISGALQGIDHQISNLSNKNIAMSAAQSRIKDTDFASETAELARAQVKEQMAVATLAQANTSSGIVLQLLKG